MSSRIEQIIDEIEEFIENCKYQPLSNTKIVVNKDDLEDLLAELRRRTPEEIKRYQRVISNQERILADAQAKAESIISQAQVKTDQLISEHQIMQQAYAQADEVVTIATNQAQEILDNAANDANSIRWGAIQYTDGLLKDVQDILSSAMETTQARSENLLHALQGCYEQLEANRQTLILPDGEMPMEQDYSSGEEEQPDNQSSEGD